MLIEILSSAGSSVFYVLILTAPGLGLAGSSLGCSCLGFDGPVFAACFETFWQGELRAP